MWILSSIAGILNFHLRTSACRDRIFIYGPNLFSEEDSICRHINLTYVLYNCCLAINYEEINFNEEISPRIRMKVRKHLHAERNYDVFLININATLSSPFSLTVIDRVDRWKQETRFQEIDHPPKKRKSITQVSFSFFYSFIRIKFVFNTSSAAPFVTSKIND